MDSDLKKSLLMIEDAKHADEKLDQLINTAEKG